MIAKCMTLFAAGIIFSLGIAISGLTDPKKIIGFLDITGHWNPSLLFVMLGAVSTYYILHRLVLKRNSPVYAESFSLPTNRQIDLRLVSGAIMFGFGWGLIGFCPGPALTSLATLNPQILIFLLSMSVGMYLYGALDTRFAGQPDSGQGILENK
ncbi:MAG: DUF6691 family protein [Pseudomonadota bacterium]